MNTRTCVSNPGADHQKFQINGTIHQISTFGLPTFCQNDTSRPSRPKKLVHFYKIHSSMDTVELVDTYKDRNHIYDSSQFCFDHVINWGVSSSENSQIYLVSNQSYTDLSG